MNFAILFTNIGTKYTNEIPKSTYQHYMHHTQKRNNMSMAPTDAHAIIKK